MTAKTYALPISITVELSDEIILTEEQLVAIADRYANTLGLPAELDTPAFRERCIASMLDDSTLQGCRARTSMTPTMIAIIKPLVQAQLRKALADTTATIDGLLVDLDGTPARPR